jgi:hypothetical protein
MLAAAAANMCPIHVPYLWVLADASLAECPAVPDYELAVNACCGCQVEVPAEANCLHRVLVACRMDGMIVKWHTERDNHMSCTGDDGRPSVVQSWNEADRTCKSQKIVAGLVLYNRVE